MDSLTNVSIIITTVLSLLCILTMVSPTTAYPLSRPNVKLIQKACNHTINPELCLNYLSKTPQVVSASTQKSPLALAIAIAEAGLIDARLMRGYAWKKTARSPAVKSAYAECAELMDGTAAQLELALDVLKSPAALAQEGASDDASYSLMVSIDGLAGCNEKLASVRVEDRYIKTSAKHVEVCSVAADSILTDLKLNGEKNI